MASLLLKMSISLDGYVASPDGSGGWKLAGRSDDARDWVVETVSNAGAHLVGAATYAEWAAYWPGASGPFAEPMNEIPKVVFSNSLKSADWGQTTIVAGDLADAITRLKQERSGGYLLAQGGARFALGERLFTAPLTIEPMSTTVFSGGGVGHVFAAHA